VQPFRLRPTKWEFLDSLDGALSTIAPGEALLIRPEGTGVVEVLGRIRIEQWSRLAQSVEQPPARVLNDFTEA
jgi:hypothetical protein